MYLLVLVQENNPAISEGGERHDVSTPSTSLLTTKHLINEVEKSTAALEQTDTFPDSFSRQTSRERNNKDDVDLLDKASNLGL